MNGTSCLFNLIIVLCMFAVILAGGYAVTTFGLYETRYRCHDDTGQIRREFIGLPLESWQDVGVC